MVLFVCTGNLCRSPSAELLLAQRVSEVGPSDVTVESAGTLGTTQKVPTELQQEAAPYGLDLSAHRPRRFDSETIARADLVIGMERSHLREIVLADPPWGTLHGSHETGPAVHAGLLAAAHAVTAPGGRLVVLTHEVRVMEQAVADAATLWTPDDEPLRVFAKGHHPRIWVLRRSAR